MCNAHALWSTRNELHAYIAERYESFCNKTRSSMVVSVFVIVWYTGSLHALTSRRSTFYDGLQSLRSQADSPPTLNYTHPLPQFPTLTHQYPSCQRHHPILAPQRPSPNPRHVLPHSNDDESALVDRAAYETLWSCCGGSVEGTGDMGPPDGWCYEGRHTIYRQTPNAHVFRADSTIHDDKLVSCATRGCHGRKRKRSASVSSDDLSASIRKKDKDK
ncbi:uncharacterized protein BJ212DRAFT_1591331, partial [Suillus subaureus]